MQIPPGNGKHPVLLVAIAAPDLAASSAFYKKVFGWQLHQMSPDLTAAVTPAGPSAALRRDVPAGSPAAVPFIQVPDVESALEQIVNAGGAIERAPWTAPMVGTLARFRDSSGTVYGLTSAVAPGPVAPLPTPIESNPKPPAGAICSLEMYAADGAAAARFFGDLFGWGSAETMPQYMGFDPGAGIGGVFQSHTPAAPAMVYIYAPSVAATIGDIEAAGGKRMGDPMAVPGFATFGYFTDPSGTVMGLIGS